MSAKAICPDGYSPITDLSENYKIKIDVIKDAILCGNLPSARKRTRLEQPSGRIGIIVKDDEFKEWSERRNPSSLMT